MVISTTALGMDSDWKKTSAAPRSGMKLSFMDSLHGSLEGLLYKLLLPTWVYSVPFLSYPKHVQNSFDELESNLKTLVMESRIEGGKNDLLSLLAQQDTTSEHIDEQSVIGNLFSKSLFLNSIFHFSNFSIFSFLFELIPLSFYSNNAGWSRNKRSYTRIYDDSTSFIS